jgi:ribose transport system substrate-binding protein
MESMTRRRPARPLLVAVVMALVALAALAGCGSDSDSGSSSGGSGGSDSAGTSTSASSATLDALYKGTYESPPTSGPAPARGRDVWLISCGQSLSICAAAMSGAQEAGDLLGWKTTVFDGKFNPTIEGNGIRQAIAAGADAIVLYAMDCDVVKSPLTQAKKAGITVIGVESLDCSETNPGQPSLFDGTVTYVEGPYATWIKQYGAAQADWTIADSGGKAEMLALVSSEGAALKLIADGVRDQMKTCSGCKLDELEIRPTDAGPPLTAKTQQALLQHPDADYLIVPFDGLITSGVSAALQASGRAGKVKIVGTEGQPPNMQLVRDGKQAAGVGIPIEWEGYAAIDGLVRLFAGREPVSSGIGIQVYDADHNVPKTGGYVAPFDFRAAYRQAWGVG